MRKITTLLGLMLLCFISTWAQDYTIQVIPGNGTFYRKGEVNTNNWCERFVSNGTPQVVVNTQKTSANPLGERKFNLGDTSGYSFSCGQNISWDLSVEDGYYITGYKIVGQAKGNSCSITPAGGTAVTFTSGGESTVDVSGLWTSSTSYVTKDLTGGDGQIAYTTYEIYVTKKPVKTVEWATENPFTPNDNASAYYVGITTPGTTSNKYTMTAFSFYENSGYGAAERYAAICKSAPSSSTSWKIDESEVLAISNENTTPTAEGYIDYTLSTGVELTGATTYYMVFLTSNTASGGQYTVGAQRVRFKNNSTYAPTVCLGNGTVRSDLIPGFKATLSTDALFTVNYTAKSTVDGSDITSGTFNDVMGTITLPTIDGYLFAYATTTAGDPFDITQPVTEDLNLNLYYGPIYDVTYNLYYGSELKGTAVVQAGHGSAPVLPAALDTAPFMSYTYDVTEITAATTVVNVTATWHGPFEISTDYDNATWYYLQQHTSYGRYNYTDASDLCKYTATNDKLNPHYAWAFIGNVYDGFKVINKGSGAGMYMKDASAIKMDATGTVWSFEKIDDTHFCLYNAAETIGDGKYINSRSAGMGKWNSNDAGSRLWVTEVPQDPFYDDIIAFTQPFIDAATAHSGEYFQLASSGTDLMNFGTALNAAETNHTNGIAATQTDYDNIVSLLRKAVVYPETGNFRFKSSGKRSIGESYLSYGVDGYYNQTGLVTVEAAQKETNLSTVFKVTKVGDNQYTLSTQGLDVQTISQNNKVFPLGEGSATVFSFVANAPGVVAISDINNSDPAHACLHEAGWTAPMGVVRWTESSDCSQWTVEEAGEISVAMHTADDNKAYATFYAPFDATFTGGVTAYTITRGAAIDGVGSEAVMAAVSGVVPAGTPVVLVDETGTVAAATANVSYGAAALGVENILSGHYLAGTVADGSLVFGQYNSTPGFYRYDDYSTVLGANRAFIAPAQANNVRAFVFVSPETGISTTLFNKQNGSTYDLQGRRVQNAQKGIYILNGKKVLVK